MPSTMDRILILNILKTKAGIFPRLLLLLLALSFNLPLTFAQSLILKKSVPVNKPSAVSIDRLDNIYVTDRQNNLHKLDAAGQLLQTYSPSTLGHLALVEAFNPVKILLFSDDRQTITLLDRFLAPITTSKLTDLTNGIIRTATLAPDNQIWLVNESNMSLIKSDLRYPESASNTRLNTILNKSQSDIRYIREYQNNLYLIDKLSGIYVFDNMGNYKKKLPVTGISYLGFKGNKTYYLKENKITFLDLYTLKEQILNLPSEKNYTQALVGNAALYLFSDNTLDIYELPK